MGTANPPNEKDTGHAISVAALYDQLWQAEWNTASQFAPSVRTRYRILTRLMRRYGLQGDVLDVGGGNGALWRHIGDEFEVSVTVVDISPEAMSHARASGLNAVVDDITAPKVIGERRFDAICCIEVLEHIPDDRLALATCNQLLHSGGLLYVTVPHSMKYWTKNDDFSHHHRRYEVDELRAKFADAGFTILEMFTWEALLYKPYYFLKGEIDSRKLLAPSVCGSVGAGRRLVARILYCLFHIEDWFRTKHGVALYTVAQRS